MRVCASDSLVVETEQINRGRPRVCVGRVAGKVLGEREDPVVVSINGRIADKCGGPDRGAVGGKRLETGGNAEAVVTPM